MSDDLIGLITPARNVLRRSDDLIGLTDYSAGKPAELVGYSPVL